MGWGRGVLLMAEPRGEAASPHPPSPQCPVSPPTAKHLHQFLSKVIIFDLFSPSTILKDNLHKENSSPSPLRLSTLSCQQRKATGTSWSQTPCAEPQPAAEESRGWHKAPCSSTIWKYLRKSVQSHSHTHSTLPSQGFHPRRAGWGRAQPQLCARPSSTAS